MGLNSRIFIMIGHIHTIMCPICWLFFIILNSIYHYLEQFLTANCVCVTYYMYCILTVDSNENLDIHVEFLSSAEKLRYAI